jgi:excisionase family DNA binding protein
VEGILTVQEIAAYLKVSRSTVWRWCNTKKIPAFKVGRSWRISRVALDQFIEEGSLQSVQTTSENSGETETI